MSWTHSPLLTRTATFKAIEYATKIELNEAVEKLNELIASNTISIEDIKSALETVNTALDDLDDTYINNTELTDALSASKSALDTIEDTYATDTELKTTISNAEASVKELYNQAIAEAESKLNQFIENLQTAINTKADATTVNGALKEITTALQELKNLNIDTRLTSLESLTGEEGAITVFQGQVADLIKQVIQTTTDISTNTTTIATLKTTVDELKTTLDGLVEDSLRSKRRLKAC